MKFVLAFSGILVLGFSVVAFSPAGRQSPIRSNVAFVNVIEGTVYDPNHRAVPDLWIELQNEFYLNVLRVRTTGSGRFTFSGIGSGRDYIKVYTTGTDYEEQSLSVEVVNVVQNGSSTLYQDVYLRYDKNKTHLGSSYKVAEAVFSQTIPPEALHLYKSGLKDIEGNDFVKGADEIDQALKIFPDYYDALNTIGCKYVEHKEFKKSLPYLIRSIDVNRRSFSSFYSLAYAAFELGQLPEAAEAARASVILAAGSVNAQLLYGTVLRMTGKHDQALAVLLKAEKLSKDNPVAEVHWQLALLYNRLKRNKEAADQLETYLRLQPDISDKKEVKELIEKLRSQTT